MPVTLRKKAEIFELRESQSPYKVLFDTEKIDIAGKTYGFGMNKKRYRGVSLATPSHPKPQATKPSTQAFPSLPTGC